jgi:hypothetical protein
MSKEAQRFWEACAAEYQRSCQIPIDVLYGPGSPNEAELGLIGPVEGKHILELGCGGAQCAIAFALQGATVTAGVGSGPPLLGHRVPPPLPVPLFDVLSRRARGNRPSRNGSADFARLFPAASASAA